MVPKKNKALSKAKRPKRRYIVFEVKVPEDIADFRPLFGKVKKSMTGLLGEMGMEKANLKFINDAWNHEMKRAVIKVNHAVLEDAKEALNRINELGIKTVGVSGSLKKIKKKYLGS